MRPGESLTLCRSVIAFMLTRRPSYGDIGATKQTSNRATGDRYRERERGREGGARARGHGEKSGRNEGQGDDIYRVRGYH